MEALTLVKILRPILPGRKMQAHLTDCAAYEVLDRAFQPCLPPLTLRQVLGLEPMPNFNRRRAPNPEHFNMELLRGSALRRAIKIARERKMKSL
jgi:hypothetical protein